VDDETVRSKLEKEINELETESQKWHEQSKELRQTQEKMTPEFTSITILEKRLQAWQSFLQRESVATIVGSLLLFVIAVSLLIAMFRGVATSEIINNSFLVILGYFFGQTVSRNSNKAMDQI
jgi:septal ring factor EnvC (AmiA/AmiB activator)